MEYSKSYKNFNGELKDGIDLSKEVKGTYFIEIIADSKKIVKKIILN